METEKQYSFKELYYEEKKKKKQDSPASIFVKNMAELCCVNEQTVRCWIAGTQKPSSLAQKILANHFQTSKTILFPEIYE